MGLRAAAQTRRLRRLASHLAAGGTASTAATQSEPEEAETQRHAFVGPDPALMARYQNSLSTVPRVNKDTASWTASELLRRCQGLGATDEQLDAIVEGDQTRAALLSLVQRLEPPPPQTASIEAITVDARTTPIADMAEILERVGAVVLTNAAPQAQLDEIDAQLEAAGCWAISRGKQEGGRPASRMQMELLVKAPLAGELVTNEYVLGVSRHVLGPHCKRIALKELSAFEVQPGNARQNFHREDQFWPWHHEPDTWAVNMLWALDDFTEANGGTQMIPYSHRSTLYMRENGREFLEVNDPDDVLKLRMPRGSVLLFAGGLMHGSGANSTRYGRKSLLSSFQLGWLRPEYKFWAHKELHQALSEGRLSPELTDLMGHFEYEEDDSSSSVTLEGGIVLGSSGAKNATF